MIGRLQARLAGERGTTIAEVAVATMLIGVIAGVIMSSTTTMARTSARMEERSFGNTDLRTALEIVERDLRAANPIVAIPAAQPVSRYRTEVSFSIYCADGGVGDCNSRNELPVTYRLTGNTLERVTPSGVQRLIGPSGPSGLPAAKQQGAVVNTGGRSVFRYFDERGNELETDGASTPPSSHFHICTLSMRIDLVVVVEAGDVPVTDDLTTTGTLRNYRTREVDGCV